MRNVNRMHTAPVKVPRTNRNHAVAVLTSLPAGKCVPVAAIPMLREDALNGSIRINCEMLETKEILMNPVNLRVTAYVVPWLAFERFEGSRDQFDRSYMGQPKVEGGSVVPFFETFTQTTTTQLTTLFKYMGLHGPTIQGLNTAYVEAYNAIWNFRAKNRSRDITARGRLLRDLAPAFWNHSRFAHVVPDFDQAVIDGEVALNIVDARVPVSGIGKGTANGTHADAQLVDSSGLVTYPHSSKIGDGADNTFHVLQDPATGFPAVFAELQENGITVSLSNIEMARKTQAFAKLRERFEGHDEEWIIDMLMDGLTIPDQALKQPILIADKTVRFAQAKRYATDAGNLAESAVSGAASLDIRLRVPKLSTGGVVMVIAEAYPEQLFERQADPFLFVDSPDDLPEFLRDTLDPEKVDVVRNKEIDVAHGTPDGTFGYAPLNWKWNASGPKIGGKFYRPSADLAVDEERQRLWAVEDLNPTLSESFYLVDEIHTKPFLDTESDPFELTGIGNCVLNGNTVFGGVLVEATANYDKVAEKAPTARIEKE